MSDAGEDYGRGYPMLVGDCLIEAVPDSDYSDPGDIARVKVEQLSEGEGDEDSAGEDGIEWIMDMDYSSVQGDGTADFEFGDEDETRLNPADPSGSADDEDSEWEEARIRIGTVAGDESSEAEEDGQGDSSPQQGGSGGSAPAFVTVGDCFLEDASTPRNPDPNSNNVQEDEEQEDDEDEDDDEAPGGQGFYIDKLTILDYPAMKETKRLDSELKGAVDTGNKALEMQLERLENLESFVGDEVAVLKRGLAQECRLRWEKCEEYKEAIARQDRKMESMAASHTEEVTCLKGELDSERKARHKIEKKLSQLEKLITQNREDAIAIPIPPPLLVEPPSLSPPLSDDQTGENENESMDMSVEVQVVDVEVAGLEGAAGQAEVQVKIEEVEAEVMDTQNENDGSAPPPPPGDILAVPIATPRLVPPENGLSCYSGGQVRTLRDVRIILTRQDEVAGCSTSGRSGATPAPATDVFRRRTRSSGRIASGSGGSVQEAGLALASVQVKIEQCESGSASAELVDLTIGDSVSVQEGEQVGLASVQVKIEQCGSDSDSGSVAPTPEHSAELVDLTIGDSVKTRVRTSSNQKSALAVNTSMIAVSPPANTGFSSSQRVLRSGKRQGEDRSRIETMTPTRKRSKGKGSGSRTSIVAIAQTSKRLRRTQSPLVSSSKAVMPENSSSGSREPQPVHHGPVEVVGNTPGNTARFYCTCGLSYAQKSSLNRHLRFGSTAQIFKCSRCTSVFPSRESLGEHRLAAHPGVDSPPKERYVCAGCAKVFELKDSLSRHRAVCAKN